MEIIKKSALGLSAAILFILLFVFGLAFGLHRMFSGPDTIKSVLKDSGIYQSVVGDALKQAQKQQKTEGGSEEQIPVDRPDVQNVIKGAVSPELLQSQTEKVIDSVYAWVQGKTPKLQFAIELDDVKVNLANGIEQYAKEHMATLPVCTSAEQVGGDPDPFNATCLPPGADVNQVAAEAKNQILNGDFLKDAAISSDTIKTDNGKTLEQQLQAVPAGYQRANQAFYAIGALAVVFSAAVVFLSVNWRSGLKKLSIIFIVVGVISATVSWLASFGVSRASEFAKEPLQQSGIKVAQALADDLRSWWMWYGIVLVVVGVVTLVVLRFTRPSAAAEAEKLAAEPTGEAGPAPAAAPEDLPKSPAKQKPKPVKKLVQ